MNNEKLKNEIKAKIAISKFYEEDMAMKNNKNYFVKIAVSVCACLILTTGIVFAKDIENIIRKIFKNTSPAIEQAVDQGYIQSIENDFVYDKDIGIKVDNIVLDDLNLNVSIKFENKNKNIASIRFNKFILSTDTNEIIYDSNQQYVTDIKDVYTATYINWKEQPEKLEDNIFADSILFTLGERSKEKKELIFKIQSLDITYDDNTKEELYGEWNFNLKITEKMRKNQTIKYVLQEENEHIESCTGTLSATGLEATFNLKNPLNPMDYHLKNSGNIKGPGLFFIKNVSGYTFPNDIKNLDTDYKKYVMKYDSISIFPEIPETIEIYLEPYDYTIVLEKSN